MRLHDIQVAPTTAIIWGHWFGGNGRAIDNGIFHAVRIERRAPFHEIGTPRANYRIYWRPWDRPTDRLPTDALCHNVQTRARWPRFYDRQYDWAGRLNGRACETCATFNPTTIRDLNRDDPWTTIPDTERPTTPDPVTGL